MAVITFTWHLTRNVTCYNVQLCWGSAWFIFCDKVWSWGRTTFEVIT